MKHTTFYNDRYQFIATIRTDENIISAVFRDMSKPNSDDTIKILSAKSLTKMFSHQLSDNYEASKKDIATKELGKACKAIVAHVMNSKRLPT